MLAAENQWDIITQQTDKNTVKISRNNNRNKRVLRKSPRRAGAERAPRGEFRVCPDMGGLPKSLPSCSFPKNILERSSTHLHRVQRQMTH